MTPSCPVYNFKNHAREVLTFGREVVFNFTPKWKRKLIKTFSNTGVYHNRKHVTQLQYNIIRRAELSMLT